MKPINMGPARWQPAMHSQQGAGAGRQVVAPGGRLVSIAQQASARTRPPALSGHAVAGMGQALQARRQAQLLPLGCALRVASFQAGQATLAGALWDCMASLGTGWVDVAQAAAIAPPA